MKIDPEWFTTKKIIVCSVCKGEGRVERSELTDYHRGDYDCWNELCKNCDGEGRVVEVTSSFRIEFKTPDCKTSYTNAFKDYQYVSLEKLAGRATKDLYKIKS